MAKLQKIIANIGLWLLAYLGAATVAGLVLYVFVMLETLIGGSASRNFLLSIPLFALIMVYFAALYASPFAIVASAIPEAQGRKPRALIYGGTAGLAGVILSFLYQSYSDLPGIWEADLMDRAAHTARFLVTGVAGGVTMAKLRTGSLRPR